MQTATLLEPSCPISLVVTIQLYPGRIHCRFGHLMHRWDVRASLNVGHLMLCFTISKVLWDRKCFHGGCVRYNDEWWEHVMYENGHVSRTSPTILPFPSPLIRSHPSQGAFSPLVLRARAGVASQHKNLSPLCCMGMRERGAGENIFFCSDSQVHRKCSARRAGSVMTV